MKITIAEKDTGPLTKIIKFQDGKIEKDSSECWLSSGSVIQRETTLEKFASGLRKLKQNQALIHGVNGHEKSSILSEKRYTGQEGTITRTKKYFNFVQGEGSAFFDHDPQQGQKTYSKEELLETMAKVFPAIGGMATVWTPSTSSCIYKDDKQLVGENGGMHIYFAVKNATDLPRFSEVLFRRLWLAGHGYIFITKDGKQLERTIFDKAVFSPERLDFVAGAICKDGLEQKLPDPVYTPGNSLDTSLLLDLTVKEESEYQRIVVEAKNQTENEALAIRGIYIQAGIKKLVQKGQTEEAAKKIIENRIGGDLIAGDVLLFCRLGEVQVAEVIKDPGKFDKETLRDPIEPEYGANKAIFYANTKDSKPVIYSQAHGGRRFFVELKASNNDIAASLPPSLKTIISLFDENGKPKTKSTVLIEIGSQYELFHDGAGEGYATINKGDYNETWPIKSKVFTEILADEYFALSNNGVSRNVVADATDTLRGKARVQGRQHEVYRRTAYLLGKIYIDLCTSKWEIVEVSEDSWQVLSSYEVKFLRSPSSQGITLPEHGGSIESLWPLVNIRPCDRPLVAGFLVRSLHPKPPYFGLCVVGQQGTGKSTFTTMLRSLIDPSTAMLRPPPRDERDFLAGAINNWCLTYDNLSGMQPWLSDALCRILTGGSFAARTLYSTTEETTIPLARPAILNGIDDLTARPDLADRVIVIDLQPIDDCNRIEERELWAKFNSVKGKIFGSILDGLCSGLKNIGTVKLPYKPRMLDAAKWATASETGLGMENLSFINSFKNNQRAMVSIILEASPFVAALLLMIKDRKLWEGTPTELRALLTPYAVDEEAVRSKAWPKSPAWVTKNMTRHAPALRKIGIEVEVSRNNTGGHIQIEMVAIKPGDIDRQFAQTTVTTVTTATTATFNNNSDSSDGNDSKNQELSVELQEWEAL